MPRPQCWAYDPDTKLRCSRPGGHPGSHRVSKEFDDDTAWVPLLSGADLAAQVTDGVVVPLTVAGEPTAPTEIVIPEQEPDYQIGGTCVVCQHSDAHLSPEEAGDAAGCQHNGCMCLTAVWV